jgi:hypothetical protein
MSQASDTTKMTKQTFGVPASHGSATSYQLPPLNVSSTGPFAMGTGLSVSRRTQPKAMAVASFLIHLAVAEAEPDFLTHLRLQKLLYFAQGWSLARQAAVR